MPGGVEEVELAHGLSDGHGAVVVEVADPFVIHIAEDEGAEEGTLLGVGALHLEHDGDGRLVVARGVHRHADSEVVAVLGIGGFDVIVFGRETHPGVVLEGARLVEENLRAAGRECQDEEGADGCCKCEGCFFHVVDEGVIWL